MQNLEAADGESVTGLRLVRASKNLGMPRRRFDGSFRPAEIEISTVLGVRA